MDAVHLAIGVTSVVALIVVMASSLSQVSGRVVDRTAAPFSDLVSRGDPVADQVTPVEGEPPLVEGDCMDATCSLVQSISSKVCACIGPLMPQLGSKRESSDKDPEAAAEKKPEPEPAVAPPEDPPKRSDGSGHLGFQF